MTSLLSNNTHAHRMTQQSGMNTLVFVCSRHNTQKSHHNNNMMISAFASAAPSAAAVYNDDDDESMVDKVSGAIVDVTAVIDK